MFGHIEEPWELAEHMRVVRELQERTGGFTEFVPLSFIPFHTLLGRTHGVEEISREENLKHTAAFRLALGRTVASLQASWVKMGLDAATESLRWGVNDLGGTLMEESISRMAGSYHGVMLDPPRPDRRRRTAPADPPPSARPCTRSGAGTGCARRHERDTRRERRCAREAAAGTRARCSPASSRSRCSSSCWPRSTPTPPRPSSTTGSARRSAGSRRCAGRRSSWPIQAAAACARSERTGPRSRSSRRCVRRWSTRRSPSGRCSRTRSIVVSDGIEDAVPPDYAKVLGITTLVCTPLSAAGRAYGVICADRGGGRFELSDGERHLLWTLGKTAALVATARNATRQQERPPARRAARSRPRDPRARDAAAVRRVARAERGVAAGHDRARALPRRDAGGAERSAPRARAPAGAAAARDRDDAGRRARAAEGRARRAAARSTGPTR